MATPRNAAAAADTMARQWLILQHIPRFPGHTSSASLHTMLEGEGHHVTRRTLERDLVALTTRFPLECDDSQKPFAWCWSRHAKVFDIPGMEPAAALAFRLVQIWGSRMLPGATQTALQPHFSRAQQVLKDNGMLSRWTEKIRIVERGPPTHPPKVADGVLQVVYAALLQDRWCTVNYRARGSDTPQTHQLNPLGLIVTHGLLYLVCTINAHQDPRQLLLHRMSDARPLDRERVQPKDFDLDTYLRDGNLGLPLDSKPIRLKALFHGQAAHTVAETPLSGDQTVRPGANGALEVHATVADTLDLRGWIFGFGEMVEVLAPQSLRDEFKRRIKALSKMYVK